MGGAEHAFSDAGHVEVEKERGNVLTGGRQDTAPYPSLPLSGAWRAL